MKYTSKVTPHGNSSYSYIKFINKENIYRNWNSSKSSDKHQEKLTKILNKLISLEDELEKLTKNYTWQELANIPRLKAKACIMYRKENNCGLCDAYKAINEYVDNLNNSRT